MEKKKISILYSWPVIILTLIFIWPVGIFLTIKRVQVDKKSALTVGKGLGILGVFCNVLAILMFIISFTDGFSFDNVMTIIFFGVPGLIMCAISKKSKKRAEKIKKYLAVIINDEVCQMDNIAATIGTTYDVVRTDVQMMIADGFLSNAYIDDATREVVIRKSIIETKAVEENQKIIVVACNCCGANNKFVGTVGECEYCGTYLQ